MVTAGPPPACATRWMSEGEKSNVAPAPKVRASGELQRHSISYEQELRPLGGVPA